MKRAEIYTDIEQFYFAAKEYFTVGQMWESSQDPKIFSQIFTRRMNPGHKSDSESMTLAMLYYELAYDLFELANEKSRSRECRLKVARIAAQLGNYQKAALVYEEVAKGEIHPLSKPLYIEHLFYSLLCRICIDRVSIS